MSTLVAVPDSDDEFCHLCSKKHVTKDGHPACPGHIRNGKRKGIQFKALGDPCAHELGWGTSHPGFGLCKLHGGAMPIHVRRAQIDMAMVACDTLGVPVEIDPGTALLELVYEWQGNVAFYRALVAQLPTHPEDDIFTPSEDPEADEYAGHWERGAIGIYGRTYHQSGIPTGEAKRHILVQLYEEASDRLSSYAQAALKAGVDERQMQLNEALARKIFSGVAKGIDAAKLTAEQAEAIRRAIFDAINEGEDGRGEPVGPALSA
jgi:hypothetical protein